MEKISNFLEDVINAFSFIFFIPVIIICFLFTLLYDLFDMKFDLEVGLEVVYNLSVFLYVIFCIFLFICLLG